MVDEEIHVEIALSDPQLENDELQEAVISLRKQLAEVDGVTEVFLIRAENAPQGSMGIGSFLLGKLGAIVTVYGLKTLVKTLANRLFNRSIELEVRSKGKKLHIKLDRAEDLEKALQAINQFIKG